MKPAAPNNDDTVRVVPRRRQRGAWLFVLAAVLGVAMLGSGCYESVGYESAERYVDRVRPILRAAAAAAAAA